MVEQWVLLSVRSMHVLPVAVWVSSGGFGFLAHSKDIRSGKLDKLKLPLGVTVSVCGCICLYVWPAMDWCPGCILPST